MSLKAYKDYTQEFGGICVILRDGESFESLYRRFKKKVNKSGIEKEMLLRTRYEKPSIRKRRKRVEAIRRLKREQLKIERFRQKVEKKRGTRGGTEKDED